MVTFQCGSRVFANMGVHCTLLDVRWLCIIIYMLCYSGAIQCEMAYSRSYSMTSRAAVPVMLMSCLEWKVAMTVRDPKALGVIVTLASTTPFGSTSLK